MPPSEPGWWYAEQPGSMARALAPVAALWGLAARRRLASAPRYRPKVPVLCAGNFTAGGTGKTPLALHLGHLLHEAGERPGFLSRGYGGTLRGPVRVDPERHGTAEVGDEPLLLAAAAMAVVARDRAAGAVDLEQRGASVIVMDDGLQNPQIAKDLTFAVVDGERGIGNGEVMPAGPLRAPLASQLAITDAIVIMQGSSPQAPFVGDLRSRFPGPVLEGTLAPAEDTAWLAGVPVVAYAGIGRPAKLFASLDELGARLVERVSFPDHHRFSEADARRLLALASRHDAMLVTTAKDRIRLAGAQGVLAELRESSRVLPVRLTLKPGDDERLLALVQGVLRKA
ncbi:MAG: tetraacyldisaccharide 4'-kinase [Hyphomicrobiaceae bacterium]